MKTFIDTQNANFTFNSCSLCDAMCCDGKRGTVFSQLILKDFKEVYENFPIVFLLGDLGYLKPVVLLTNGKENCRYLKDFRCSVYEKRPSVCKIYPLSPNLTTSTFIDTSCPAVNSGGELIVKNGVVEEKYKHPSLDNYIDKYIDMHEHFHKFNKKENLEFLISIGINKFYKFKEDLGDEYIKLHLSSLKNLDKYFKA